MSRITEKGSRISFLFLLRGYCLVIVVWTGGVSCCCIELNAEHVEVGLYW